MVWLLVANVSLLLLCVLLYVCTVMLCMQLEYIGRMLRDIRDESSYRNQILQNVRDDDDDDYELWTRRN